MSDLAATNCGCGCEGSNGCSSIIWILLLLCCCGNGGGFFGRGDGCGNGCDSIWIILLILCCCGNGHGFGCFQLTDTLSFNKKGRYSCLFCYFLSLLCISLPHSFCICIPLSCSFVLPDFLFLCKHASSSSYTRFPSMINRPMDFLLNKKDSLYIICIF